MTELGNQNKLSANVIDELKKKPMLDQSSRFRNKYLTIDERIAEVAAWFRDNGEPDYANDADALLMTFRKAVTDLESRARSLASGTETDFDVPRLTVREQDIEDARKATMKALGYD